MGYTLELAKFQRDLKRKDLTTLQRRHLRAMVVRTKEAAELLRKGAAPQDAYKHFLG